MSPFQLGRRPPKWLRVVLAGLVLAFVLDSVAAAAHHHDAAARSGVHGAACGYCLTFGSVADGASAHHKLLPAKPTGIVPADVREIPVPRRLSIGARPRAPPVP